VHRASTASFSSWPSISGRRAWPSTRRGAGGHRPEAGGHSFATIPTARQDLGIGLKLLAISLSALGRRREAVAAATEAKQFLRALVEADRSANLPALAAQLAAEGTLRIENGEFDQGIAAAAEALDFSAPTSTIHLALQLV
jgi:hypothetical protein